MNFSATSTPQNSSALNTVVSATPVEDIRTELRNFKPPGRLFSLRGALLLVLGMFLVFGPAPLEFDIVASILGFSLLTILWLIAMFNVVYGNYFLRNLSIDLLGSQTSAQEFDGILRSNQPVRLTLRTSEIRVPTFFVMKLSLEFESKSILTSIHQIIGSSLSRRIINDDLVFPHRGDWILNGISLRFVDQFGFSHQRERIAHPSSFRSMSIKPPLGFAGQLPVLSSSHRAGDDVSADSEHQGDPYDLKPYHPGDGIKKILWKVYARTGELIARHQERSMTPEGQVVVYVLARTREDYVCSTAISYVRSLKELDLEVVLGCEGMAERALGRDADNSEELLVQAAFDSDGSDLSSQIQDIARLTGEVQRIFPGISLDRILLFCGRTRFTSQKDVSDMVALGQQLQSQGVMPVFFVVEPRTTPVRRQPKSPIPRWIVRGEVGPKSSSPEAYSGFVTICARYNWEVILA